MQSPKFYLTVAVVGALADLLTNLIATNSSATTGMISGLKTFYSTAPAWKTALLASITFVIVVLIADFIYTEISKNKQP